MTSILETRIQALVTRLEAVLRAAVPDARFGNYATYETINELAWVLILESLPVPAPDSDNMNYLFEPRFRARLVGGYATEGYDGDLERRMAYGYMPGVTAFLLAHPYLCLTSADAGVVSAPISINSPVQLGVRGGAAAETGVLVADWVIVTPIKVRIPEALDD